MSRKKRRAKTKRRLTRSLARPHHRRRGRPKLYEAAPSREAMEKRAAMAGPNGDPAKTAHPIDWLETRQVITARQADAGRRLHTLRMIAFGCPDISAFELGGISGYSVDALDETAIRAARFEYDAICTALKACGGRIHDQTIDLCIHGTWPVNRTTGAILVAEVEKIKTGLSETAAYAEARSHKPWYGGVAGTTKCA